MQLTNPFPGMNPFLEGSWPGVHQRLIGYISDALAEDLPEDLRTRPEEDIEIETDEPPERFRADVAVHETWSSSLPGVRPWESEDGSVAVAEPEIIEVALLPPHRWVEIRDIKGRLITVIEVLSPTNKSGKGSDVYLQKQQDLLHAGVNLVEIDLLRTGATACLPEVARALKPAIGTRYLVIATRAQWPSRREVYYCPLRDPLPVIRVPLRRSDLDVPLALQPLIDRVYRTGRYWQDSHFEVLSPALTTEDAAWVEERLQLAGLKDPV